MKSSMGGILLWCLLAGFYTSAFCQAASTANNATLTTDKVGELTPSNPIKPISNVVEDKPTAKEVTTTVPTTSEPVTTPAAPEQNTTTTVAPAPAPDSNTTTTVAPDTTTTPTTTTTTTIAPNTTTPSTTTTTSSTTTTTTVAPNNSTTTTTPAPTTPAPPTPRPPCNHFDFPSFIGGIVLTLGTLAISLVAYKFYKARNERNYHTL